MNVDTGSDKLLCSVEDGVATITINRPEARNALGDAVSPALRRMIRHAADDASIGCVLITGAGAAFCAGGDIKGMSTDGTQAPQSMQDRVAQLQERQRLLTGAIIELRKPTLAVLPGPAAGAGLAIALACDMRIAAESAFATTGYTRIGLSGDYGISWLLNRAVGKAKARELMFLGERIDAAQCLQIGLFNRVVSDDQLITESLKIARQLANGPRTALARMKDNLDEALACDFFTALDREAERLVETARHPDHDESVRAFIEKRAPRLGGQ